MSERRCPTMDRRVREGTCIVSTFLAPIGSDGYLVAPLPWPEL